MKQSIKYVFPALLMLFALSTANAQVTTSALGGRVVDSNGEPVIGAAIVATHTASGTTYGVITNENGRYSSQGMRSGGPYTVEISCLGYQTVTYTGVSLALAETYNLNAVLKDDSEMLEQAVVVAAPLSKFAAAEKTGASTNISNEDMLAMPTVNRSITDFTRLSAYGGNGMTFAGTDGRTSNFTVDGANFNNNFGLSDGLPGGGNPISIDAIEEMQIVISPYDVRQTNFIGGGVNAITKSGTNTFKGTAYIYHKNENMQGDTVAGEQISGAREKDRTTTYGFTLGGPVIKNKLFFFVNAEYLHIPSVVNRWRGSSNGTGNSNDYLSRTTLDDLEKVKNYVKEKYGYDTGSYTSFPANEHNLKLLARIDWNINQNNHLAVRYNYTNNTAWNSPNGSSMDGGVRASSSRMSVNSMSYANSMYSYQNLVHTFAVDLNSRISDNLSNQFLATFSKLDDVRGSGSDEFPFIDILDGDISDGTDAYLSLGYELFTWNNAVHNTIFNLKDDLTWYKGNHKLMGGVTFEYQMADNAYMRNGTGYYRYSSLSDFLSGAAPEVVCLTYGYDGESNPAARVRFYRPGIYAQDEWTVNDRFKLTYGLRVDGLFFNNGDLMTNQAIYELSYYPASHNYEETHIDTGKWPGAKLTLSPRVGFTYDLSGDKRLKLRGGTGLFSGRLPLVFFTNMPTNSGMVQYQAKLNGDGKNGGTLTDMSLFSGGLVTDANGKATIEALYNKLIGMGYPSTITPDEGTLPSEISAVDPKFKMPQVWKTSLALDYTVPVSFPFSLTVEGIFNKTVNAAVLTDWSVAPVEGFARFNGADSRPIYPDNASSGVTAYVLENTQKGYGWIGSITLNMTPVKGLDIMAAYTHMVQKEITDLPGSNASSVLNYIGTVEGPNNMKLHNAANVTPDRIVASINHHDKCGNHFSLIYETWRGGYNYSFMTTNDMNGDGYNYDLIYIPTDKEVADNEFRFVSQDDADRFMAYVHNTKYLKKHQGQYAETYSLYNPFVHRVDFSYKHDFKVRAGGSTNTLQLCLDIKNLLNLFNSNWGVSKYLNPDISSSYARVLTYEGADSEGYATFSTPSAINGSTETFVKYHALSQCWYASVGIKYMFN